MNMYAYRSGQKQIFQVVWMQWLVCDVLHHIPAHRTTERHQRSLRNDDKADNRENSVFNLNQIIP